MRKTNPRKVGGLIMLAVQPDQLNILNPRPGQTVGIAVEGEQLVVEPQHQHRCSMDELLAQCNPEAPRCPDDNQWLRDAPVGSEVI